MDEAKKDASGRWTARITTAPDGDLRLQFSEPMKHIDMTHDTARQLAALILVAAEGRQAAPLDQESDNVRSTVART